MRRAISATNSIAPRGQVEKGDRIWQVRISDQLRRAEQYRPLVVRYRDGAPVRLGDIARLVGKPMPPKPRSVTVVVERSTR